MPAIMLSATHQNSQQAAVAGNCDAIITYNLRDFGGADKFFGGADKFNVRILTPGDFLQRIGEL